MRLKEILVFQYVASEMERQEENKKYEIETEDKKHGAAGFIRLH